MGLIHIPRVAYSIGKGFYKQTPGSLVGLGPDNPHIYESRAGLFDVDSYGHMNNAAYLTHAEFARWEMSATNGLLKNMYNAETNFLVASTAVRYRRELRPVFRKFHVETYVGALDERNIWM
jgi:acyl-CoA thioesterase FadM